MTEGKYLIYLDILGFEQLAQEMGGKTRVEPWKVRKDFLDVINERVEMVEARGEIVGKRYGGSDDWLLVTDSFDKVFQSVSRILNHNSGYLDLQRIPLEIAVGTAEFGRRAKLEGAKLSVENDTIKFLKTNIVDYYRKYYREGHDNQSVKSTFIVLTESAYCELEPFDKKMCRPIKYKGTEFFAVDPDVVLRRGKVFDFLDEMELSGSKLYHRIDELFVPPSKYEDVRRTLKEKRIVFITGSQEYGKTYTAIRLMWEFYNQGYLPRWIKGGERDERISVRARLENIDRELKPKQVIYFEDPFGKTQYERRETLEREISTILNTIKQGEDAYVILTSREEVFKEFEKERLSRGKLEEFEHRLSIKKPSYGYRKRREILLKWAEAQDCKWLGDKRSRNLVLDHMRDEWILPTPLSIRDFAVATVSTQKEEQLREKINEKSEETAKALAREIENMSHDKILFLSFLFIFDRVPIDFIRTTYQEVVSELNIRDAWGFDRMLNWFRRDKIESSEGQLGFSHSSYFEALKHLLIKDGFLTWLSRDLFSKLLSELSEKGEAAWEVAHTVAANFDRLPEEARHLLFKLSEKDEFATDVIWALAENFHSLPENVRNLLYSLLFKHAESDDTEWDVAWVVALYFHEFGLSLYERLPDSTRDKIDLIGPLHNSPVNSF